MEGLSGFDSNGASSEEGRLLGPVRGSSALAHERQYAIRKRYLIPGWWLLGYVAQSLSSDLALLPLHIFGRDILFGSDIPPRCFHLFCSVWTEILKVLASGNGHLRHVDVRVDGFLRGTSIEITQQLELLESYWALPFRVSRLEPTANGTKRKRKGRATAGSQLNFVRACHVSRGSEVVLSLDLGCTLEEFWCGSHGNRSGLSGEVVSLNPDVVMAFGSVKSMKKLSSYLLLEFAKRFPLGVEGEGAGWFGGLFDGQTLWAYHKDLRGRTNSLYEHGVLGWEESAPRVRVRDVRRQLVQGRSVGAAADGPSVLHLVRASQLSQRAVAIEETVRQSLTRTVDVGGNPLAPIAVGTPEITVAPSFPNTIFAMAAEGRAEPAPARRVQGATGEQRTEAPTSRRVQGATGAETPAHRRAPSQAPEHFRPPVPASERPVYPLRRPSAEAVAPAKPYPSRTAAAAHTIEATLVPPPPARVVAAKAPTGMPASAEDVLFPESNSAAVLPEPAPQPRRTTQRRAATGRHPAQSVPVPAPSCEKEESSLAEPELHVRFANFYYDLDERQKEAVERMRPHMSQQQIMDVMSCFEASSQPPRRRR